jgi:SAM-dependent methyltransferase
MAHYQQLKFVKNFSEHFIKNKKLNILELGSYNYNGTIRNFFSNCNYIGVDVAEGPNVDIVYNGKDLNFNHSEFDISISCECFEHNPFWVKNFIDLINFTKPDGFVLITCATLGRPEHGTFRTDLYSSPSSMKKWNFYKNLSKRDFEKLKLKEYFSDYGIWEDKISRDLYFLGIKKGKLSKSQEIEKFSDYIIYQNSLVIKRDERLQKIILRIFKYICQNYLSKLIPDKYFRNLWIFIKKLVP